MTNPLDPSSSSDHCMARVGLLSLRPCNHARVHQCNECGMAICQRHTLFSDNTPMCPGCASQDPRFQKKDVARRERRRRSYYDRYHYAPGYYHYGHGYHHHHHHGPYSDKDYESVDPNQESSEPAGPADDYYSGVDDGFEEDDFMES